MVNELATELFLKSAARAKQPNWAEQGDLEQVQASILAHEQGWREVLVSDVGDTICAAERYTCNGNGGSPGSVSLVSSPGMC